MTTDEGDLDYMDLVSFLWGLDRGTYGNHWVGVLHPLFDSISAPVKGSSYEGVRRIMEKDYAREASKGFGFSVAWIPRSGDGIDVKFFMGH